MTQRPFLSERFMTVTIPRLNARGLETDLGISGQSIAFDRNGTVIGPVLVVVRWANQQPRGEGSATVNTIGLDGDLIGRPAEIGVVRAGDLFMLQGATCEVTTPVILADGEGKAGFRFTSGGA